MPRDTRPLIRRLPFWIPEPEVGAEAGATYVGRAYKSLISKIEPTYAIDPSGLRVVESGGGEADLKILSSYASLRNFLNISWDASANYGYGEARTRGSYLEEIQSTKYKLFITMKKTVERKMAYLERGYRLTPEYRSALALDDLSVYQNFGDRYVQEVYLGGEFVCLINLSSESYFEHKRLVASLDVSVESIGGGVSISAEKVKTILERHLSINVQTFWSGVHRSPPIVITGLSELGSGQVQQSAILQYFADFENIVKADAALRPVRIATAQAAQDWPNRDFIDLEQSQLSSGKLNGFEDEILELRTKWEDVAAHPYNFRDAYDQADVPVEDISGIRRLAATKIEGLSNLLREIKALKERLSLNPFAELGDVDTHFWRGLQEAKTLPFRQRTFTPVFLTYSHCTKHKPTSNAGDAPNQNRRVALRGNDIRVDSMWFPHRRGTRLQIWSLKIEMEAPRPIGIRIEYKAEFADGYDSGWVIQGVELVHPTARGTRFRRIAFRLQGQMADAYNIEYQVHRTEYGDTVEVPGNLNSQHPAGTLIGGPTHNIENIRLAIWPKSDIDEQ